MFGVLRFAQNVNKGLGPSEVKWQGSLAPKLKSHVHLTNHINVPNLQLQNHMGVCCISIACISDSIIYPRIGSNDEIRNMEIQNVHIATSLKKK